MDIINLCFSFYQLNLLVFLTDRDNRQFIGKDWDSVDWSHYREDYIMFELSKVFADDTNEHHRIYCQRSMAWQLSRWKQYQDADSIYKDLIAFNPEQRHHHQNLYNDYGIMLFAQERYDAALQYFLQSSEIGVASAGELYNISNCYDRLDDLENAKKYYKMSIETWNDPKKKAEYCVEYAAFLREKCTEYDLAKQYLREAMQHDPDCIDAYDDFAFLMRITKNYEESQKYYMKCLEMNDTKFGINAYYAFVLYLMRDYGKAVRYIDIEMKREKHLGIKRWIYSYHAIIHKAAGNDAVADESFCKAIAKITTEKAKSLFIRKLKQAKGHQRLHANYYKKLITRIKRLDFED